LSSTANAASTLPLIFFPSPPLLLLWAPLFIHLHLIVAWISRGQFRIVHLVRGNIHDLCHLASRFIAELLKKGGENHGRRSSHPRIDHQYLPPASPIPGSSNLRLQTQSIHSNGLDTHLHTQAQIRRLQHTPSQSSL
jgi:hypothetical protein